MLISKLYGANFTKKATEAQNENYFLNIKKHYPFFKLFDIVDVVKTNFKIDRDPYERYSTITEYKLVSNKNYLLSFLHDDRSNSININSGYLKRNSYQIISSYVGLHFYNSWDNMQILFSTCTLGVNDTFVALLCIKPEYVYYVKLCLLANQEIEFDCFYILYRKDAKQIIGNYDLINRAMNSIDKIIKHYNCNVIKVDSIEAELNYNVILPKFTTMKDYHKWLNDIESNFIKSLQNG